MPGEAMMGGNFPGNPHFYPHPAQQGIPLLPGINHNPHPFMGFPPNPHMGSFPPNHPHHAGIHQHGEPHIHCWGDFLLRNDFWMRNWWFAFWVFFFRMELFRSFCVKFLDCLEQKIVLLFSNKDLKLIFLK